MLEVNHIREHKTELATALAKRNPNIEEELNAILSLDDERKAIQAQLDELLASQNKIAKDIGMLFKEGRADEANKMKSLVAEQKEKSNVLKDNYNDVQAKLSKALYNVPNAPHPSVPLGKTDEDNEEIFAWGSKADLPEKALPHWELAKKHDLIDFELGVKITGAGFPVYTGKGARLQRALIQFFLDEANAAGYKEIIPPHMVNEASGYGTGQLPDKEGQMYHVTEDDLYLIPTAEVPITNIYRDVILKEEDFPIKMTGYTPCFRREAGSYGKDVRGLNRLHQFDKVEIVRIEKPENSYKVLDEMVEYVKGLLEKLGLQYRVLRLCAGDLGFTSALTFDMEVYSAAQDKWLEVSSISNFETYQANRLKLRYKDANGKKQLAHTLNGSALALPRILAALLENYQTETGIKIPEVLQKYTGFDEI